LNCSEHWNNASRCPGALPRTSLPDQVFHRLVSDVLAGRYAPGERLPTQRALAAELGVNMASVREGVKRLEQLGSSRCATATPCACSTGGCTAARTCSST
jgi:DNA-binding transcriptional MocR family regulator